MATADTERRCGDSGELAGFGYKQELDRSLGSFSSFAAGFSYISILTGVIQLFAFGFLFAGPAVWWTWLIVLGGQMLVALCFAEMAGQYPLAGSVYQWSKRVAGDFSSWMTGWIYVVGSIVTVAAVAVAWQVVLPQVSPKIFQIARLRGRRRLLLHHGRGPQRAAARRDPDRLRDDRQHARRQDHGADQQLRRDGRADRRVDPRHPDPLQRPPRPAGSSLHNLGLGKGHSWHYFGAFIIGGIMSAYVMYGFDTAGTLAEETNDPRRARAPGDHPRADRGGDHRRPADPVRADGGQEHQRPEHRRARPPLHHQAGARQHRRQRVPDRLGDRDQRLHARGDGVVHPTAVRDGA